MAIKQKFISLDDYFHSITTRKFILNNYSIFDFNHAKAFYNSMITEIEGDTINILPRCTCGHLRGEYYKGVSCPKCDTVVSELNYDPVVWAKAFSRDLYFLNPMFYYMLNSFLQKDIPYLCGLTNEPRTKGNICIAIARNVLHNERTYRNFLLNIRNIIVFVSTTGQYKQPAKAERARQLLEIWDTKHDILLSEYIPMVNNVLFTITKTNKGKFVDTGLADVFDVASIWMRVSNDPSADSIDYDKTTAKVTCTLGNMPEFYIKGYLAKKSGIFRKHGYSCRSSFTSRSVIVSRPGKHLHNEVVLPWSALVSVFRPHVLNKLMKLPNMTYKEASLMLYKSAKNYDPIIGQIGDELLKEAGPDGYKVLVQRNPSLLQGSAQLFKIKYFKQDPRDNTLEFSQLTCRACNGSPMLSKLSSYVA